jgi:serpin B
MKRARSLYLFFATLALQLCLIGPSYANAPAPSEFANSVNQFSLKLLHNSNLLNQKSFLFSPLAIYSNLLSLSDFATEENKHQIESALYADNPQHTEKDFAQLSQSFAHYFHESNTLWVQQPGNPQRQDKLIQSSIKYLDFNQSKQLSTELINEWIASQTENRCQNVLDWSQLGDDSSLIMTSLTELDANWLFSFDPKSTRQASFYPISTQAFTASYMQQTHYFPFFENKSFSMVLLPYQNELLALAVLLPKPGVAALTVLGELKAEAFNTYLAKTHYKSIDLSLLKTQSSNQPIFVSAALQKGGLLQAFQPNDYPALAPSHPLQLSKIIQLNQLALTESGTRGGYTQEPTLPPVVTDGKTEKSIPFHTNHPFAVILYDLKTEAILAIGVISGP